MGFRQSAPAEGDLLCESCGYILNGLDSNALDRHCPECGEPLSTSVRADARKLSPVEIAWTGNTFWRTTASVLFRKRKFFRETRTRVEASPAVNRFGRWHRALAGTLFGIAAAFHLAYTAETRLWLLRWDAFSIEMIVVSAVACSSLSIAMLRGVTWLAVWMTTKESKWWGMRLPSAVLTRAMNFHAANYLPVGLAAVALTGGYRIAYVLDWITPIAGVPYLIALCVLVVAGAFWLFESFVIAMRRIRFANF